MHTTQVVEWQDGAAARTDDYLAVEEPLEIRAGRGSLGVTLRTPGDDLDLVAGFLFTEGIISRPEQLLFVGAGKQSRRHSVSRTNLIRIQLKSGARIARSTRLFYVGSACRVCGKATIAQIRRSGIRRLHSGLQVDPQLLCELPDRLRAAQPIFGRTGALHAAAIFDAAGVLAVLREDIGRHNAVDKVIGWAVRNSKLPLNDFLLVVSGRGGFEIIQKALVAGIPVVASVGAPSSLAVQLARELGLTLVGFLRGRRFVIYAGEERLNLSFSA